MTSYKVSLGMRIKFLKAIQLALITSRGVDHVPPEDREVQTILKHVISAIEENHD